MPEAKPHVAGRRVLIVEDEYFIAEELAHAFQDGGAEIVGPVSNVDDALDLIEEAGALDAAVLDMNLQGEMVYPVADALLARGVPFVFATGYDAASIPAKYETIVRYEKPVAAHNVGRALFA
jgi:CheY-like chemotaxis protein